MAFTRNGYGQVEPNQLSAQKTGQIYASLPLEKTVKVLQNGEFMFYDMANGVVTAGIAADAEHGVPATVGEPMLVYNEVKLYEPFWRTSYKDFAMIRVGDNYVTSDLATAGYGDGATNVGAVYGDNTNYAANPTQLEAHSDYQAGYRMDGIAPRLFKTNVGDIYTTNMVEITATDYAIGQTLKLKKITNNGSATLVLTNAATGTIANSIEFTVVKVYTMPDGQPGLKLQRTK